VVLLSQEIWNPLGADYLSDNLTNAIAGERSLIDISRYLSL
jgi:hypothetical protein